jgi:hypothetical protein
MASIEAFNFELLIMGIILKLLCDLK